MVPKREKMLLIVVVSIIIVSAVAFFILVLRKPTTQSNFHLGGQRLSSSGSDPEQYRDEHTDEYAISHPVEWKATQQPVAGGGHNTTFMIPADANSPSGLVTIQRVSADTASLAHVEKIFTGFGYKKAQGTIQNTPAVRFAGNFNGSQETVYVFERDNIVYTMMLSYVNPEPNQELENQFYQVANSFRFN